MDKKNPPAPFLAPPKPKSNHAKTITKSLTATVPVTPNHLKEARTNLTKVTTSSNPTQPKLATENPTQPKLATANPTQPTLATANPTQSTLATANPTPATLATANPTPATLATANLTQATLATANPTQATLATADPTQATLATADPSQATLATANPTQGKMATADQNLPKIKTEKRIENPSMDNFDNLITEPIRNCYVIAPLKGQSNTFVTIGDDKEIRLLKVNLSQTVYSNYFHTLVNVRQDITRHASAVKIVKAGTILKGKSFHVERSEVTTKLTAYRINIEGVGKDAENATDLELMEKPETSVIEKLEAKVVWIAPKIFNNKKNIKIQTENGMPLLLSLFPPYHEAVIQDKVYTFLQIEKTPNWTSTSSLINNVEGKFKTTARTEIILQQNPSKAFQNLNKSKGKVVCIDQELTLFDQCPSCYKTRYNNICMQTNCTDNGIRMLPNEKFVAKMVIIDQDNNAQTIKIWSDQMMDLPNSNLVPEGELREVLILNDLERHYENKFILFKKKPNINHSDDAMTVYEVTISEDFMDIS